MASVALISTWVGYELAQLQASGVTGERTAYDLFLHSLPYSGYCWLMLAFVLFNAILERDFGPMLAAERRAVHTGQVADTVRRAPGRG